MTLEERLQIENHSLKLKIAELEREIQRLKTPIEQSHYIRCAGCNATMHNNTKVAVRGQWGDGLHVIASNYCDKCKR